MRENKNIFKNYPDAMSLSQVAECLGISKKLASRLIRSGEINAVKIGREYRIAKSVLIKYIAKPREKNCFESVTSNPKGWTSEEKCGMLCGNERRQTI